MSHHKGAATNVHADTRPGQVIGQHNHLERVMTQTLTPCETVDPETFFPDKNDARGIANAQALCAICPLRVNCANWALAMREEYGVWGGLSERDRCVTPRRVVAANEQGEAVPLTVGARAIAISRLDDGTRAAWQVADMLRTSVRTVQRHRAARRETECQSVTV